MGKGSVGKGIRPGAFWLEKKNPIEKVDNLKCPVLYIHGKKDWVILSKHSEELYEKTTSFKKLILIKDGPHAEYLIRKNSNEILPLIKNWFNQTL
jgi:dipeptidyl aminopeptidase/acylaminoacyl peptidase